MSDNYLEHVGVLGMRWGVRKDDGSGSGYRSFSRRKQSSDDHVKVSKIKTKRLHEMSNDELKAAATRIKLENEYKNLNPTAIQSGGRKVAKLLDKHGDAIVASIFAGGIAAATPKIKQALPKAKELIEAIFVLAKLSRRKL